MKVTTMTVPLPSLTQCTTLTVARIGTATGIAVTTTPGRRARGWSQGVASVIATGTVIAITIDRHSQPSVCRQMMLAALSNGEDAMYQKWIKILNCPEQVTGYREICYRSPKGRKGVM